MLLGNHKNRLATFSKAVKIPEMIISFLFLATGIYLLVKGGHPETYLMVKVLLVFVSIPLAVIGIKKEKKGFLAASVAILIYVYGVAETQSLTFSKPDDKGIITNVEDEEYVIEKHGQSIYNMHCMRCHGMEGDKMRYESPNLRVSTLTKEERWEVINNGKGLMPAFNLKLDENEKEALEAFMITLKD